MTVISKDKSASTIFPSWLPLSIILVVIAILHLQYLDIPLERDESLYAYLGKIALGGGKPYYDFYEMKPPMLFYSYALFIGVFGYSATGIHLAVVVIAVANTFFTFHPRTAPCVRGAPSRVARLHRLASRRASCR